MLNSAVRLTAPASNIPIGPFIGRGFTSLGGAPFRAGLRRPELVCPSPLVVALPLLPGFRNCAGLGGDLGAVACVLAASSSGLYKMVFVDSVRLCIARRGFAARGVEGAFWSSAPYDPCDEASLPMAAGGGTK